MNRRVSDFCPQCDKPWDECQCATDFRDPLTIDDEPGEYEDEIEPTSLEEPFLPDDQ